MVRTLYKYRFGIFLATQLLILFGSLLVSHGFYEQFLLPILLVLNIGAGILMVSRDKGRTWLLLSLFLIILLSIVIDMILGIGGKGGESLLFLAYFLFHILLTFRMIGQVWKESVVDNKVIMGLISGYISLGFLAFFMFSTIELWTPGSFGGAILEGNGSFDIKSDSIMYYAYITLLTIGYGEIVPVTPLAQKAAVLVGLTGQLYIAIITAVVVEKYIRTLHRTKT